MEPRKTTITIVDYGMGNLRSVRNAVTYLGKEPVISSDPAIVVQSDKLLLPGVGSFRRAMENIQQRGLFDALGEAVQVRKIPVLGICLGMQLFAAYGHEDGGSSGLGWIPGEVAPFKNKKISVRIPHIGFNSVQATSSSSKIFGHIREQTDFYFVHSYYLRCDNNSDVALWCDYYGQFCAGVERDNVFGTQFHPEKSQANGLDILDMFLKL